ncbi:MAG: sigma-70 family RNA polymerase sigma factor [Anaerolineae bacterium]
MQRIAQRDQAAMAALYQQYGRLVHNMAYRVLKNQAAAEEITQDVFMQIWRQPDKWNADKGQFSSWVLAVTRYTAIDRLRKDQRRPTSNTEPIERLDMLVQKQGSDPTADNGRVLRLLISRLPNEQRQVIFLAFFRGMTHSDIAEHLNVPVGTVKSRIRLGLQKLKEDWFEAQREPDHE